MKQQKKSLMNLVVIGLFAAFCYLALLVLKIPVGPMFVHLGNLLVVLAALLFGGWQAGLAGALGMGMFDVLNGWAATSPKTFVLKFLIGFVTGLIFHACKNKKKFPVLPVALMSFGSFLLMVGFLLLGTDSLKQPESMKIILILLGVLGVFLLLLALVGKKLQPKPAFAVVAAVAGVAVNLVGETAYLFVATLIAGSKAGPAFVTALAGQASTVINCVISVIGGVVLYLPLARALKSTPLGNYYE